MTDAKEAAVRQEAESHETAQELYDALVRITKGKPQLVSASARVTKSLVAKEAGLHRSTLNKMRYPELCRLIDEGPNGRRRATTASQKLEQKANANKELKVQIARLLVLNNDLSSKYISLGLRYVELTDRVRVLEGSSKVVSIGSRTKKEQNPPK